jgi:predicted TPR repeat methyltransferase
MRDSFSGQGGSIFRVEPGSPFLPIPSAYRLGQFHNLLPRFEPRQEYLRSTLTRHGFAVQSLDRAQVRCEFNEPVIGFVIVAAKQQAE